MSEVNFYSTSALSKILSYIELAAKPKVVLSAGFFRKYSCPSGCGGCCHKVVLEYIEGTERWERFKSTHPELVDNFSRLEIDNIVVYSDSQLDNKTRFCKHLNLKDGRCKIHTVVPFPCEFVLSKFIDNQSRGRSILTTTNYGRGWSFLRVDHKTRGAMCEMLEFSYEKLLIDLGLLRELDSYATLLGIETKLPRIISWIEEHLEEFEQGIVPKQNILFEDE